MTLALDDFGTGYLSLGYLNTLPIDTIKVDRTFFAKLTPKPDSRAIVGLAHSIGMSVVCEGGETAQQHQDVTALGSDARPGFYFAKPTSAESVAALAENPAGGIILHLPT